MKPAYLKLWNELKKEIDVKIINKVNCGFIYNVLKGEILFTRDEEFLTDFIERIGSQYSEFSYLNREFLKEVLE